MPPVISINCAMTIIYFIAAVFSTRACEPAGLAERADSLDFQMTYLVFQPLKVASFWGGCSSYLAAGDIYLQ
jgi:hypothetical protein